MDNNILFDKSRRKFIRNLGITAIGMSACSGFTLNADSDESTKARSDAKGKGKLGIALVGLGSYSGGQLAPALQQTEHCYLAGIVTGTPSKVSQWQTKYSIPDANVYNYENFDTIKNNQDIDIVYVVLPNSMHEEYVIRAAKAGKHVICEKPMALTVEECDTMIAACKHAGKMLSIGYRLHFEPYNLEMARLGQQKVYGNLKNINAGFGFNIGDPSQWRLKKTLSGGGPLQDLGIYCIQGICYTSGLTPIAVTAKEGEKTNAEKFAEVEQSISWQFELPGGITANGACSYADRMNHLKAEAEKGIFQLTSAFGYSGQEGGTPSAPFNFPRVNQQARQMDDFAQAIKNKRATPVPGEMGRRDVKLITAIYESMQTGNRVQISKA